MKKSILIALFLGLMISGAVIAKAPDNHDRPVPVKIKRLLLVNNSPAVLLVNDAEDNYLLVFVDFFMAHAIRMGMEDVSLDRPMTHDLMEIFLRQLGAKLARVEITDLKNSTYYALMAIEVNGETIRIDARPSDALALAVRTKAPVFANGRLLKAFGKDNKLEGDDPGSPVLPELDQAPQTRT